MNSVKFPYGIVLIDLFSTLVDVDEKSLPKVHYERAPGGFIHSTADEMFDLCRQMAPRLHRETFLEVYFKNQEAIRKSWREGVLEETSCVQKFATFLRSLGEGLADVSPEQQSALGEALAVKHMQFVVDATVFPESRREVLRKLRSVAALALISNFDHGPSGRAILERHGIAEFFKTIVISDEVGKRKPHALLFEKALRRSGSQPSQALMIGDSALADIDGAAQLGIHGVWVKRPGEVWPSQFQKPLHVLDDFSDLLKWNRLSNLR